MGSYKDQFRDIEQKWQERWQKEKIFEVSELDQKKEKFYVLVEFPYPSGAGLHVGHTRSYYALDILCRKKRMEGKNVLYPFGWDAFGLPTEHYAIKTKQHPAKVTATNIANFKRQIKKLGIGFDWSREVNTTDPKYYRWTQWIFLQLFKKGLAYKAKFPINWCSNCKIGIANEELENGKCERCGSDVDQREKEQWMLRMTVYADRLIDDLHTVQYLPQIVDQQKNWIGRSEGAVIKFPIFSKSQNSVTLENSQFFIEVFTTRPDTLFGATYLVLAPEHPFFKDKKLEIINQKEIDDYITLVSKKTELERTSAIKDKTGVKLEGVFAKNPANNEEIPIFVADYVFEHYGSGAIMAVPAHDERDFAFAEKFHLPMRKVIASKEDCYSDFGILINSGKFNGMNSQKAQSAIIKLVDGKITTKYRLRDWVFSRQRYWGEPIPLIYCQKCSAWIPVPEDQLPVLLPMVKFYEPTDTGESPLANISQWVNTICPKCGGPGQRETDTMPNWAGSSWYWLRYTDPHNDQMFAELEKLKYWTPVDLYNGGMEHSTRHLLYARFWHKFLFDEGLVPSKEPFQKRVSHGLILAEDGSKMSKSKGNVVNPEEILVHYSADTLKVYMMFMGPYEEAIPWSERGLVGVERFLNRVWNWAQRIHFGNNVSPEDEILLHLTIQKISHDIENLQLNTAVSSLMIYFNHFSRLKEIPIDYVKCFLILFYPFAPHLCSELWELLWKNEPPIFQQSWPVADEKKMNKATFMLVVQVNGKFRDHFEVSKELPEQMIYEKVLSREKIKKILFDKTPKKFIYVKEKLINIVF